MRQIIDTLPVKDYHMCLRDAVEIFTKELINGVIDTQYKFVYQEKTTEKFLKILERLNVENGETIWENFKNSFDIIEIIFLILNLTVNITNFCNLKRMVKFFL